MKAECDVADAALQAAHVAACASGELCARAVWQEYGSDEKEAAVALGLKANSEVKRRTDIQNRAHAKLADMRDKRLDDKELTRERDLAASEFNSALAVFEATKAMCNNNVDLQAEAGLGQAEEEAVIAASVEAHSDLKRCEEAARCAHAMLANMRDKSLDDEEGTKMCEQIDKALVVAAVALGETGELCEKAAAFADALKAENDQELSDSRVHVVNCEEAARVAPWQLECSANASLQVARGLFRNVELACAADAAAADAKKEAAITTSINAHSHAKRCEEASLLAHMTLGERRDKSLDNADGKKRCEVADAALMAARAKVDSEAASAAKNKARLDVQRCQGLSERASAKLAGLVDKSVCNKHVAPPMLHLVIKSGVEESGPDFDATPTPPSEVLRKALFDHVFAFDGTCSVATLRRMICMLRALTKLCRDTPDDDTPNATTHALVLKQMPTAAGPLLASDFMELGQTKKVSAALMAFRRDCLVTPYHAPFLPPTMGAPTRAASAPSQAESSELEEKQVEPAAVTLLIRGREVPTGAPFPAARFTVAELRLIGNEIGDVLEAAEDFTGMKANSAVFENFPAWPESGATFLTYVRFAVQFAQPIYCEVAEVTKKEAPHVQLRQMRPGMNVNVHMTPRQPEPATHMLATLFMDAHAKILRVGAVRPVRADAQPPVSPYELACNMSFNWTQKRINEVFGKLDSQALVPAAIALNANRRERVEGSKWALKYTGGWTFVMLLRASSGASLRTSSQILAGILMQNMSVMDVREWVMTWRVLDAFTFTNRARKANALVMRLLMDVDWAAVPASAGVEGGAKLRATRMANVEAVVHTWYQKQ
jgi:hypothetical protein